MDLLSFEQQILGNSVDLSALDAADPIKTREDIRLEWLHSRRGKFTASEFYRLVTTPAKDELPKGALTYVAEKAAESLADIDETDKFVSIDMQWGLDHEIEAIELFTQRTGLKVDRTGDGQQLITMGDHIGCTPDGLIGKHSGLEIKCPKSKTHLQYSLMQSTQDLKDCMPDYYWQIQGSLYITGRKNWHFASYDPRFYQFKHKMKLLYVKRNEKDISFLARRLELAIEHKLKLIDAINQ